MCDSEKDKTNFDDSDTNESSLTKEETSDIESLSHNSSSQSLHEASISLSNTFNNFITEYQNEVMPQLKETVAQMIRTIGECLRVLYDKLYNIDFSYLFSGLKDTFREYEKVLHECILDAKWFPYVFQYIKNDYGVEFATILDNTGYNTKRRTKEIDNLIYRIFNKTLIEKIRKSWRDHGIPQYKLRILNQAVYAYHRKEYALTAITLSTMWQGMIADKTTLGVKGYQKDSKTKAQFRQISDINDFPEPYDAFFKEYIMYECHSENDVKEDVPGRHSFAHSWFNKYPSRKAALNAILLTDCIIKAEAVTDDSLDNNKDCTS